MDPFVSALEELAEALSGGEDPERAVTEIAENTASPRTPCRMRRSGIRSAGDLGAAGCLQKDRERSKVRADPVLAAATFLAEVADLSPKLSPEEWDAAVERLAAEFGVDAEHRSAIDRVRRRY